ncbi:SIR2 family protein [Vibrio splendidus]
MSDAMTNSVISNLEPLENYHEYKVENETIDDDESGYAVYFQKGDDDPVLLAKPSLALYHGDQNLYNQESERIRLDRFSSVLNTDVFPRNKHNFDELLNAQRSNKVTPFVGAGASISAGCQSWNRYLELKAVEVGIDDAVITQHLNGNMLEDLLDLILRQPRGGVFEFYFMQDFEHANPENSYVWNFPDIFNACVITTNFDRVIEECYARQGKSFKEKTVGLNNPHNFIKAMTRGDRYLLKLHGNMDNPEYRVFTKEEYQRAYSNDAQNLVDINYPLPKLLTHLYLSHSFLFIGCSLEVDRTVKAFEQLFEREERNKIADHYAIIEAPENNDKFHELEQRLMSCNIKPIWYENKQYEKVNEIIGLMMI